MPTIEAILTARRGLVEAPAGCGKTQLIVDSLMVPTERPTLILTHTTAGVAALQKRLATKNIPKKTYKVATIDSWAIHSIKCYPFTAGYLVDPNNLNYIAIRDAATRLCSSGAIDSILQASYGRLLVDEYQDCSVSQHALITALANVLPTVIFGDPLQAIFGFGDDPLPAWQNDVLGNFPHLGMLTTPWRWNRVGAGELGSWLLMAREALIAGQSIDIRTCPNHIEWLGLPRNPGDLIQAQVTTQYDINQQYPEDNILIIGDSINADTRHSYARRARGVQVVEAVDLRDTLNQVLRIVDQRGESLLTAIIEFLSGVMVNVEGNRLITRVRSIVNGRNRTAPTAAEAAAVQVFQNGGYAEALTLIKAMRQDPARRVYRSVPFRMVCDALHRASIDPDENLIELFVGMREQRRHSGRNISGRSVGSTLLLKGLEADHVVILDADNPDARKKLNAHNLYVAMTRGAKTIKVFSRSPILPN
ncbi:MAG: UvrD-helicase domain-containing protein [Candidatus Thiodiazotropha sp. (ex Lucinoma borealis)]|nr:UvrD-helicase domain-containing protein [Candidatus Thiodiazotropha sp. (ex Lucinoma borealis)]